MTYEIKALKGGFGSSAESGTVNSKKGSGIKKEYKKRKITYPESDGKRMADNTLQFQWIVTIKEGLEVEFLDNPDVFVAGDFLWYPVEGSNKIRIAPDAMVVFGRPKGHRGSYLQWKEDNITPHVVFEVLSPGNTKKEMEKKFEFYQKYGVEEYYIYDPDNLTLKGWIRSEDKLISVDDMKSWISPRLNIRFEMIEKNELVLYHSNGERFLTFPQLQQKVHLEKQERLKEFQRAEEQQKRAEEEQKRAEEEQKRAEEERKRAEEERKRAEEQQKSAEEERKRAEEERKRAEEQQKSAEEERKRAEEERKRAEEQQKSAEEERKRAEEERKRAEEQQKLVEEERKRSEEQQKIAELERQRNKVIIQNLLKSGTMNEVQIAQIIQLPIETIHQLARG